MHVIIWTIGIALIWHERNQSKEESLHCMIPFPWSTAIQQCWISGYVERAKEESQRGLGGRGLEMMDMVSKLKISRETMPCLSKYVQFMKCQFYFNKEQQKYLLLQHDSLQCRFCACNTFWKPPATHTHQNQLHNFVNIVSKHVTVNLLSYG